MSPEEVSAAVAEVRERVRQRYQKTIPEIADFELPSLDSLGHARDAAEGKAAAIGKVNPRPPGFLHEAVQRLKRLVARSLNWLVREQIDFNRAAIAYMDRNVEAMIEQNHNALRIARELAALRRETTERLDQMHARLALADDAVVAHHDLLRHWSEWRPAFERRAELTEIRLLHQFRELEANARHLRQNYDDALSRSSGDLQKHFWAELGALRETLDREVQSELRVLRRRLIASEQPPSLPPSAQPQAPAATAPAVGFDYARFEERFRGSEEYISSNQQFYVPYFQSASKVVDLGCGRGEFLALLRQGGLSGLGVDLDDAALAACREKGLEVEKADLFEFLERQPDASWGGIFCAHVVEHLPPTRLPLFAELAYRKLAPGGVFALETPNPACLAIFAGDFYVDPTHERPVPSKQLEFHLREAGFGAIEVTERHPAIDVYPELDQLDAIDGLKSFRERFFGGLDYAIIGRKREGEWSSPANE